ncbi:MAG TPA: RNA polymerase sigma factor [Gammaproteobacteria bacterium]|nr:RNA polymerase sigma factor [Gammaproteobacteria bacterium]
MQLAHVLRVDGIAESGASVSVDEVFRRHHVSLVSFLRRRLRVPEDAFDVAQETYLRMLKYQGSREIESPASMLFKIAANAAIDHSRAAQSHRSTKHLPIDDVELVSEQPSAERSVSAAQSLELLTAAIDGLPPKCREVFLLSREHGMTYLEIAHRCAISVKMVEKHISHALLRCATELGEP